jgi:hypothetical protein
MARVYETLYLWARKTTSSFAELLASGSDRVDSQPPLPGELIYRLKHWPALPDGLKTAGVYRTLSVMSQRPVNRHWMISTSTLRVTDVDLLLKNLLDQEAVEVIDAGKFEPASSA